MNFQPQKISAKHEENITEVLVVLVLLVTLAYGHTGTNKNTKRDLTMPLCPVIFSYASVA